MRFRKEQLTQTELAQIFGVSPHVVGDWLVDVGLRNEKKRPSSYAHNGGFIETLSNGSWGYRWVWNARKTVAALIDDGHHPVSPPPGDLIEATTLRGPFKWRKNENGTHEITGSDGFPVVWVLGDQNGRVLTKLMNLADERGVFERIKPQSPEPPPERIESDGFVILA